MDQKVNKERLESMVKAVLAHTNGQDLGFYHCTQDKRAKMIVNQAVELIKEIDKVSDAS